MRQLYESYLDGFRHAWRGLVCGVETQFSAFGAGQVGNLPHGGSCGFHTDSEIDSTLFGGCWNHRD